MARPPIELGQDDRPGEEAREADLAEEALEARHGEDGDLQIGVGDEHHAEGGAKGEGAVGGEAVVDHVVFSVGAGSGPLASEVILSSMQGNRPVKQS